MQIYRAIKTNLLSQGFGLTETKSSMLVFYKSIGLELGHNGYDWVTYPDEPVYWDVSVRGTVIETHIDTSGGLGVVVISGENGKYYKHRFWHLKEFKCVPGQVLETADIIGISDSTGYSTGNHLHRDLKRVAKDIFGNYRTIENDNGYFGAIPIENFQNIFVVDKIAFMKKQVSSLRILVKAFRRRIAYLIKGR